MKGVDVRLKESIREVCQERNAMVEQREVMPDHVHVLVNVDLHCGIHRLITLIKGRSSRLLRQEYAHVTTRLPTLWTQSYYVSTNGGAPLASVKHSSEGQKRSDESF